MLVVVKESAGDRRQQRAASEGWVVELTMPAKALRHRRRRTKSEAAAAGTLASFC
jgi:hypothetical protein